MIGHGKTGPEKIWNTEHGTRNGEPGTVTGNFELGIGNFRFRSPFPVLYFVFCILYSRDSRPVTNPTPLRATIALPLLLLLLLCSACTEEDEELISLGQLINACIASNACGINATSHLFQCVDSYYTLQRKFGHGGLYASVYHCVIDAGGDCDAVFACYGADRAAGSCSISSYRGSCKGDKATFCSSSNQEQSLDCASAGLQCALNKTYAWDAKCGRGECSTGYAARCDGGKLIYCENGIISIDDCATQGLACGSDGGRAECVGNTSDGCSPGGYNSRCEGSVAYSCTRGKVRREDCSERSYNKRCQGGACAETHSACTTGSFDRCAGDKLEACVDGQWQSYDCGSRGFDPCLSSSTGASCSPKN